MSKCIPPETAKSFLQRKFCRVAIQAPSVYSKSFLQVASLQQDLGLRKPRATKPVEVSPAGVAAFRVLGDAGVDNEAQLNAFRVAHNEIGLNAAISIYDSKTEFEHCAEFARGIRAIDPSIVTILFNRRARETQSFVREVTNENGEFDHVINGMNTSAETIKRDVYEIMRGGGINVAQMQLKRDAGQRTRVQRRAAIERWRNRHEESFVRQMPGFVALTR